MRLNRLIFNSGYHSLYTEGTVSQVKERKQYEKKSSVSGYRRYAGGF